MKIPEYRRTFRKAVAWDLHQILDIPLNKSLKPVTGFKIINAILQCIEDALRRGESVRIRGLGVFKVIDIPARIARGAIVTRYPRFILSSEPFHYRARKKVVFIPALAVEAVLNMDTPSGRERIQLQRWAPRP